MREDIKTNEDIVLGANIAIADGAGDVNGASVDMATYRNATFNVALLDENTTGTVDAKLQWSDDDTTFFDDDGSTGNTVAITQLTAADEMGQLHCQRSKGRYVRAVVTVGTAGVVASQVTVAGPKVRVDAEA